MTEARTVLPAFACSRQYVGRVARGHEVTLQVHVDDRVPVLFAEIDQHPVAQDARRC